MSHSMTNFIIFYYIISSCQHPCRSPRSFFIPACIFSLQILADSPVISLRCDIPPECDLSDIDLMWQFCGLTFKDSMWHLLLHLSQMWLLKIIYIAGLETRSVNKQSRMDLVPFPTNCQVKKIVKKNKDFLQIVIY